MEIRKGIPEDTATIATHLMLAMEDIVYRFIGEHSKTKARLFLTELIEKQGNQYSYDNCWVVISDKTHVATALVYDGGQLETLRNPVIDKVKTMFGRDFNPEDETEAGEYYIDCVGVDPSQQGKGIGSKIFRFLIDEYVYKHQKTLGLLVDEDNPMAKKLYLKLGFEVIKEKTLTGKKLEQMQFKPTNP